MTPEMIFGIIMAVISIAAGGGAVGLSTRQNSKHKDNVGRISSLETEIEVLKEKVKADNTTLIEIKTEIKEMKLEFKEFKDELYQLNMNIVRLNTQLEKENK